MSRGLWLTIKRHPTICLYRTRISPPVVVNYAAIIFRLFGDINMLKQRLLYSLVFCLCLLKISVAQAQKLIPAQPELAAKAWILVDAGLC